MSDSGMSASRFCRSVFLPRSVGPGHVRIRDRPDRGSPAVRAPIPFQIQLASRVYRLPPYMFGRINSLLYEKRRAGNDVIDLGMGNPSDPPKNW